MESPLAPVLPDEALVFYLTVANNGRFPGDFALGLDDTTNKRGLGHSLGGGTFRGLQGEVTTTLTITRGPRGYLFEPLKFIVGGTWDTDGKEAQTIEVFNYIDKDEKRWIRYEEPCPKVEWVGKLGREKKVTVDKTSKPVDLTIFNPRKVSI